MQLTYYSHYQLIKHSFFFSSCSARTVEYEDKAAENLLYERYLSSASKLCVRKIIRHDYF